MTIAPWRCSWIRGVRRGRTRRKESDHVTPELTHTGAEDPDACGAGTAATIYGGVIADRTASGYPKADARAGGLAAASWVTAGLSFAGVVMAVVMGRHQPHAGPFATRPERQRLPLR